METKGIVLGCRNDGYKEDDRVIVCLTSMIETFDEVLFCDWNSPSDKGPLLWKLKDGRVLSNLIDKGLNEDFIELIDDGSSIRTHCYITDIIEMFWNITLHGKEITYNTGGIYNISIRDLAGIVGQKLNKEVRIPPVANSLVGSPKVVNINIDKYLQEFDKNTFIDINEGLENTIKWNKII